MFQAYRPFSGVLVVVIKESAALLFLLCNCLGLLLVMWVNQLFYLDFLELRVFALSVICDVLCQSFILRYIRVCIFSYCTYDVTVSLVC
jgi:hypothetical protein